MHTTNDYQQAVQEAQRTGKPIWRHADGTYAVAYDWEFTEEEAFEWTEVQ